MRRYDAQLYLAHELKKHLHELMGWQGPLTHRQFLMWQCWLRKQLNIPSKDNYYQMQIACEVKRAQMKNPNKVSVDSMKIRFMSNNERQLTEEEFNKQVANTKAAFMGLMTAPITVKDRYGAVIETIDPPLVKRKKILEEQKKRQVEARKQRQQQEKQEQPSESNNGRKNNRRTRWTSG